MIRIVSSVFAATLLALSASAAQAQSRVFVAGQGSDSNPCTFAMPCRTFQHAHDVALPGAEIDVLGPAGYGPLSIFKAITIEGNGWGKVTGPSGGPAITVNTQGATTVVSLRGLTLDGQKIATDGVQVPGTGRVEIIDCVIRNFTHDGIYFHFGLFGGTNPNTVLVSNTIVIDNGAAGIEMTPNNPFLARGVFTNVTTAGNIGSGILLDGTQTGTNAFVDVQLSGIVSDSNGGDGITAQGVGDMKVDIRNSVSSNNGGNGLTVTNARVSISGNSLVLNTNSGFSNSGTLFTFGDNIIENNRISNVGTLTPDAKQ
jgi:Right handed beta helix region